MVSRSVSSSTVPGACRREARVLTTEEASAATGRRAGRAVVVTRCLGASGGLLAAGWNSMMGRRRASQLYCLAKFSPRSRGIQVPLNHVL